jgi:hypothetical protein
MDKLDRAALKLAMGLACAEDRERARQIGSMLKDEPWEDVAQFAAYVCQGRSLHLAPWESPPCWGDSEHHPDPEAKKLLEQMLALGVSRWHPDPMEAIAEAKKGAA